MPDRYAQLLSTPAARAVTRPLGLPSPVTLDRENPGGQLVRGAVLLAGAPNGTLADAADCVLSDAVVAREFEPLMCRVKALIFDASGIASSSDLVELQRFFHPNVGQILDSGRVIVLGTEPRHAGSPAAHTAQRALEGFTRSLGKELGGRGITVQLLYLTPDSRDHIASTLRFLLSPRSAFLSGQVIRLAAPVRSIPAVQWDRPLHGKLALVTGAARGIGAAIADALARDGAHVTSLDVPESREQLERVGAGAHRDTLTLDITQPEAPQIISNHFTNGLDILVHNAGVTMDRTIAKMPEERWQQLMDINLCSQERINDAILQRDRLADNGRIICVSSMSGIAGNTGQTNYATSKAGVIGMVEALAPALSTRHATINAVAPGFIETAMTSRMPFTLREAGRRMSSLRQGGQPQDVAEAVAWLANPASAAVNGNIIRVCGQNLIGA